MAIAAQAGTTALTKDPGYDFSDPASIPHVGSGDGLHCSAVFADFEAGLTFLNCGERDMVEPK